MDGSCQSIERQQQNKMSHRKKKTLLRNLKRKAKRQAEALLHKEEKGSDSAENSEIEAGKLEAEERERQMRHILWIEREKEAQRQWHLKKQYEEKEKKRREEEEARIKAEWEERQRQEIEEQKKKDELRKKEETLLKEATKNERKEGEDWHNPIAPAQLPGKEKEACQFFMKTGSCRYGDLCSRSHPYPETSCTILMPGMYTHFSLDQDLLDEEEYDTGVALEYDEREKYGHFREFYDDVLSEFRKCGEVLQFKVSCNQEPHLRGNVYVQFRREEEAEIAVTMFNGRWYAGKQISCVYVDIAKWKSAICGLFFSNRCPKGKNCNFLHVFKNPGNEFWQADKDYMFTPRNTVERDRYSSRRSRSPSRGSYRRPRSRSPGRSRSRKAYSRSPSRNSRYRSRSRSPRRSYRRERYLDSRSPSRAAYSRSRSRSKSPSRSRRRKSKQKTDTSRDSRGDGRAPSRGKQPHTSSSPEDETKNGTDSEDNAETETSKSKKCHKKKKKLKHKKKHSRSRSPECN